MKADKDTLQETEAALSAFGLAKQDYLEVLRLLSERGEAMDRIEAERGEQFFEDAFKATSGMGLTRSMIADVARYLRIFAERIASDAIQEAREGEDVKETIDAIKDKPKPN